MADMPLAGKRIAVLVESQYIPVEIATYRERFTAYGAAVDLVSKLWGQPKLTFISEVEDPGRMPETLDVTIDFEHVDPAGYAAVVVAANYTSVRLRYFEPPPGQPVSAELVRTAPAVRFVGAAMRNQAIVKGVLCHGLWLLTPLPELLAGRRVICHEVVLADICNAGAVYTPSPTGIVVDDDLVTGRSFHEAAALVDAVTECILARAPQRGAAAAGRGSGGAGTAPSG